MQRQNTSLREAMLVVLALVALALSACGPETLIVGLEPTPTATPLPTPVLRSYVDREYGFTFAYPETWMLAEKPHLVRLSQGTLVLNIAHGWARSPEFSPLGGRTGMPAGDVIYGGRIFFLDKVIPAGILEFERKDKMVLYGETGLVEVGDLVFSMWLEDLDSANYAELDISKDTQAEVVEILESFERIEATSRPPTPSPTPAPIAEKDLITYVNDDYRLAFVYPSGWELEEISAGQEAPGGESAATVQLIKGTLRLTIQFKRAEEETVLGPSGRRAGEIEERGTMTILGREILKRVVVFEGRDKSVFLGDRFDDLELYVQLEDGYGAQIDYEAIEVSESAQSAMDAILSSLTRTGEPASPEFQVATYENRTYGFSFQYPADWSIEEATGGSVDAGSEIVELADSVILRQGKFSLVVQYQRKSNPDPVGWDGSQQPVDLFFGDAVLGEKVTVLGVETYRRVWNYNDGLKAIFVEVVSDAADLILHITLGDGSGVSIQDPGAETISESEMAALDQILGSLAATR
jgi:hypothetical protein